MRWFTSTWRGGQRAKRMRGTFAIARASAPDRLLPLAHRRNGGGRRAMAIEVALDLAALAIDEHAQARETIRGREAGTDELPQRVFDLIGVRVDRGDEIAEERRASGREVGLDRRGEWRQDRWLGLGDRTAGTQPADIAAPLALMLR